MKKEQNDFFITGKITDYLNYKGASFTENQEIAEGTAQDENKNGGADNQRGEHWGG